MNNLDELGSFQLLGSNVICEWNRHLGKWQLVIPTKHQEGVGGSTSIPSPRLLRKCTRLEQRGTDMSKKDIQPVVVYLPCEVVEKIDKLAQVRSLVRPFGPRVSRSEVVREFIEKLAEAGTEEVPRRMADILRELKLSDSDSDMVADDAGSTLD